MGLWALQVDVCERRCLITAVAGEPAEGTSFPRGNAYAGVAVCPGGGRRSASPSKGPVGRVDRLEALRRRPPPRRLLVPSDALLRHRSYLVAQSLLPSASREWIDELSVDLRNEIVTPATIVLFSLAAQLGTALAVAALDRTRPHLPSPHWTRSTRCAADSQLPEGNDSLAARIGPTPPLPGTRSASR